MSDTNPYQAHEGPQDLALRHDADLVVYGGAVASGKTHWLFLRMLKGITDPQYRGVYLVRLGLQLEGPGSPWDEAKEFYKPFGAVCTDSRRQLSFPSGAVITFSHLEYENNAKDHAGMNYTHVCMDNANQFTQYQISYMWSRIRTNASTKPSMSLTCNPDDSESYSFVGEFVNPYLDAEGYPDTAKTGITKFLHIGSYLTITDTAELMYQLYPELTWCHEPITGEPVYIYPKTMTFISGTIKDNPTLLKENLQYLLELNSLPREDRDRLLYGKWR